MKGAREISFKQGDHILTQGSTKNHKKEEKNKPKKKREPKKRKEEMKEMKLSNVNYVGNRKKKPKGENKQGQTK